MSPIPARSAPGSPSRGSFPLGGGPSSSSRPGDSSTWLTSEQEKLRLYNAARQRAAINQQGAGASLNRIGMEDAGISLMGGPVGAGNDPANGEDGGDEAPPPEYAPPRPNKPDSDYSPAAGRAASLGSPSARALAGSAGDSTVASPVVAGSSAIPSSGSSTGASGDSVPAARPNVPPLPTMSVNDEKAQMKAYYEAKDRVERMRLGESSATADTAAAVGPVTRDVTEAADPHPMPVSATSASASSSMPASASGPSVPAPYMSAAEEKEAMKRRYEDAMAKVARTQGIDSPIQAASLSSASASSPVTAGLSSSAPMPTQYLSAEQEKDIMRKRFEEASAKVAQTRGPDAAPVASASSSSRPPFSLTTAPPQPSGHLTAEQEKDLMRKRYEEATAKVAHRRPSPPPLPPRDEAPPPLATGSAPQATRAPTSEANASTSEFMSAAEEKDLMRRRFEEATSRVRTTSSRGDPLASNRPISSDVGAGTSRAIANQAAPPPLPAKPAALADYATLLSPAPAQSNP